MSVTDPLLCGWLRVLLLTPDRPSSSATLVGACGKLLPCPLFERVHHPPAHLIKEDGGELRVHGALEFESDVEGEIAVFRLLRDRMERPLRLQHAEHGTIRGGRLCIGSIIGTTTTTTTTWTNHYPSNIVVRLLSPEPTTTTTIHTTATTTGRPAPHHAAVPLLRRTKAHLELGLELPIGSAAVGV